jgi:Rrf2 family protein
LQARVRGGAERQDGEVRISAKADYAVRAVVELATLQDEWPVKAETIAAAQRIPPKFLLNILFELKHAGIVASQRGNEGGFRLGRLPEEISLADIIRAVEGPLAQVGDSRPDQLDFIGSAEPLVDVWIAVREHIRSILESVSVADVANHELPTLVTDITAIPEAWMPHTPGTVPGPHALRATTEHDGTTMPPIARQA